MLTVSGSLTKSVKSSVEVCRSILVFPNGVERVSAMDALSGDMIGSEVGRVRFEGRSDLTDRPSVCLLLTT
jgi:ABC-type uncharacterized transport system ATPase subunit